MTVIPAKAGIRAAALLGTRLRGYDNDADVSESSWLNLKFEVILKKRMALLDINKRVTSFLRRQESREYFVGKTVFCLHISE